MIPRPIVAFKLIKHHQRFLIGIHQARENNLSGRSRILCDRLRRVDRENIKLDFKTRQVML